MISGWQVGGVCLYSANCMSPNQYDPSSDTAYSKVICNEWHSCSSQQLPNKMIFCLSSLYWDLCIEHPGNKEIYSAVMYYSCLLVSLLREYFRFLSSDIRHGQNCYLCPWSKSIARNVSEERKQKVMLFPDLKVHFEMIAPLWPRFIRQLLVNPKKENDCLN